MAGLVGNEASANPRHIPQTPSRTPHNSSGRMVETNSCSKIAGTIYLATASHGPAADVSLIPSPH